MKTLSIYLNFDGTCKKAFAHYANVFNTKVEAMTYAEAPANSVISDVGKAHQDRIMHCSLLINDTVAIMGSDVVGDHCQQHKPGNNYSISLDVENRKEADRIFTGLSDGGQAIMPPSETFWNCYWGMCADAFGVQWMVSSPL